VERKLIKQGIGGYTIYLPKKWIDKKGLTEKDVVEIKEFDQDLVIRSQKNQKTKAFIDVKDSTEVDIKNLITHSYRLGHDQISIKNISDKKLEFVKKLLQDFILGFEITDIKEGSCLIENISEPSGDKYDVLLRRIFLINKQMYELILKDVSENKYSGTDEIEELRKQQDKLVLLCKRLLIKSRLEKDPILDWELLTFIMHIGHNLYYLYLEANKKKLKLKQETKQLLEKCEEYYILFYDSFYKQDIKKIESLNGLRIKYQQDLVEKVFKKEVSENYLFVSLIRENLRLVQISSSPVLSQLLSLKEIHNL